MRGPQNLREICRPVATDLDVLRVEEIDAGRFFATDSEKLTLPE